jgi:hypothetical protein
MFAQLHGRAALRCRGLYRMHIYIRPAQKLKRNFLPFHSSFFNRFRDAFTPAPEPTSQESERSIIIIALNE